MSSGIHLWIFGISLAFGAILVVGNAFGLGELGDADVGDPDVDAEGSADLDDGDAGGIDPLGWLGLGRVPLSIWAMLACFGFGGSGMLLVWALSDLASPSMLPWASVAGALALTLLGLGPSARALGRLVPSVESSASEPSDLIGLEGRVIAARDASFVVVRVDDPGGAELRIVGTSMDGAVTPAEAVVVVDYDESARTYLIAKLRAEETPRGH